VLRLLIEALSVVVGCVRVMKWKMEPCLVEVEGWWLCDGEMADAGVNGVAVCAAARDGVVSAGCRGVRVVQ